MHGHLNVRSLIRVHGMGIIFLYKKSTVLRIADCRTFVINCTSAEKRDFCDPRHVILFTKLTSAGLAEPHRVKWDPACGRSKQYSRISSKENSQRSR